MNSFYFKKTDVQQAANGVLTYFSLSNVIKVGSEQVYINGLMAKEGQDYDVVTSNNLVTAIEFISAPAATDNLVFYGVYGNISSVTNNWI